MEQIKQPILVEKEVLVEKYKSEVSSPVYLLKEKGASPSDKINVVTNFLEKIDNQFEN